MKFSNNQGYFKNTTTHRLNLQQIFQYQTNCFHPGFNVPPLGVHDSLVENHLHSPALLQHGPTTHTHTTTHSPQDVVFVVTMFQWMRICHHWAMICHFHALEYMIGSWDRDW